MDKISDVYRLLKSLPAKYRSAPFWAWNDDLKTEVLVNQIRDFQEQGIGGFFIHSREGLETEYLSEKWIDCVDASISEAWKLGMEAWIYDEDKWPSGSAGGKVSAEDPENYTAKSVTAELMTLNSDDESCSLCQKLSTETDVLAIYTLGFEGEEKSFLSSFLVTTEEELQSMKSFPVEVLLCRMETSRSSEWYNELAPTDNLNPDAVKCFLENTHEKYKARFGDHFGKTVKGFFTDEPNFCDFFSTFTPGRPWLPWSRILPEYFRDNRGYSLYKILPLLFFHGPGEKKARYDFWMTLTELFTSSYTKQLYEWCEQNNLQLTGHVLYENDMGYSARVSGASMPHYRYMHAPGIDILGDQRQEYLTVKQCTSVANQFRRETVLSETYGCTGWDFSFAGQKRVGDWQFVMGVNKRCQHLSLYSLSGCRKRDYPPSFNYHSSWWSYNYILEEYFARLAVCVSSGQVQRDILLIHPMASIWMKSGSTMTEDLEHREMNMGWLDSHILDLNKEGDTYNRLARKLLMSQFDFDFGDEFILKEDGIIKGNEIIVGKHSYKTVVIPRVETLLSSTLSLMEDFLEGGGSLIWVKPLPEKVDGEDSLQINNLLGRKGVILAEDYSDLLSILKRKEQRPLRICDEFGEDIEGFLSMTRRVENGKIITIANTKAHEIQNVILHFYTKGQLSSYNPLTGKSIEEKVSASYSQDLSEMLVPRSFEPEETRVYIIDEDKEPQFMKKQQSYTHPHAVEQIVLSFPYRTNIFLTTENAMTLDMCRFSYNSGKGNGILWGEEVPLWQGQRELRKTLGMNPIFYNGAPQRYSWINKEQEKQTFPVRMRFTFFIDDIPSSAIYVAIEKSRGFRLWCNDVPCDITENYFLDRSLIKHTIPILRIGENLLEIEVDYDKSTELEDIYLLGDFGVNRDRRIIESPKTLERGDWTFQGLMHYPGNVHYQYQLPPLEEKWDKKELHLKLGDFSGSLALVRINGCDPIVVLQGNTTICVGNSFLTDRENNVDIEIVGSLRNLLGPLHRGGTSCSRISWEDFRTEGVLYSPEYIVEPAGLLGEVTLIAR